MPPVPWHTWLLVYLGLPLLVPYIALKYLCLSRDHNQVNKGLALSGIRRAAATREIDIKKVKAIAKNSGATVNEVMCTFLSQAFYAYFSRNAGMTANLPDQVPKWLKYGLPVSMRQPVKDLRDTDFSNQLSAIP